MLRYVSKKKARNWDQHAHAPAPKLPSTQSPNHPKRESLSGSLWAVIRGYAVLGSSSTPLLELDLELELELEKMASGWSRVGDAQSWELLDLPPKELKSETLRSKPNEAFASNVVNVTIQCEGKA